MNVKDKKNENENKKNKKTQPRERLMVANDFDETLTTIFARFLSFGTKYRDRVFQMFIERLLVSLSFHCHRKLFLVKVFRGEAPYKMLKKSKRI
jgi:hypothetical protein